MAHRRAVPALEAGTPAAAGFPENSSPNSPAGGRRAPPPG